MLGKVFLFTSTSHPQLIEDSLSYYSGDFDIHIKKRCKIVSWT